jgi:archaellum component FlaF (FlaF/FlaG flagellin family)
MRRFAPWGLVVLVTATLPAALKTGPGEAVTSPAGHTGVPGCRVADTRRAGGPVTTTPRVFQVTGTALGSQGGNPAGCRIPTGATAAVLTLTAITPTGTGALRVGPTLTHGVLLLRYQRAQTTTTTATVPLTSTGRITTRADSAPTHLLIDITGYHAPASPAGHTGVPGCRVADTRRAGGPVTTTPRVFQVTGTALGSQGGNPAGCRIPTGATAAVLTLTAITPTGTGALRVGPTLTHGVLLLRYQRAQTTTTTATVPLTSTGRITTRADSTPTHLLIDITGYHNTPTPPPPTGQTTRVSISTTGQQANNWSEGGSISADGRYVAFDSRASNLVPGDTNNTGDVFVHDRQTGQTTRVSVSSTGEQANGWSWGGSISDNGRYVAFTAGASNLVPGDTNNTGDVFVHDRQTGQTTRVSVSSTGQQANGGSGAWSISADGRYIAFTSAASNLVPGDTNNTPDMFVHDRQTGQTTRVSVSSTGQQANGWSSAGSISDNGRYVAFHSEASNLVPGDTNGTQDVFVHDRITGNTRRVSVSSSGEEGRKPPGWDRDGVFPYAAASPVISANGRYVVFDAIYFNLVPGDTNQDWDVFLHDLETATTTRISVNKRGVQGNGPSTDPDISGDGRFIAFSSFASNLVDADSDLCRDTVFDIIYNCADVFVYDRVTSTTVLVSLAADGYQGNGNSGINGEFFKPTYLGMAISADGRHVTFTSWASNLVPGDTNGTLDIFVRDRGG